LQKIGRLKRMATLSLVLISLVLAQLAVGGQTRRTRASKQPPPPSKPANQQNKAPTVVPGRPVALIESPKSRALGKAFESGKLPEPLRLPSGSIDEQAAALAKAVVAGDDSSTAALYAAILASGYGVRDVDGSILLTTEHGQGLAFNAWEVASTAKLYGQGYGVGLGHLSDAFTRNVPAFKDVPLANVLLEGIRAGAKSEHPAVRFWARFIVELGRNSAAPYDLLGPIDPAKIRLDAAQFVLILSRLTGDLTVLEKQEAQLTPPINDTPVVNGRKHAALHHAAVYRTRSEDRSRGPVKSVPIGMKLHNEGQGGQQPPCSTTENQDLILSYDALASTTLWGVLAKRLKGGKIEAYGGRAGIANVVLTVLKFVASYALLKVEITMDADKLVRTKNTTAGEPRTLTAKLRMDTGKWQAVNCLRPVLNAAGLDFDLPGDGPLDGVRVEWLLVMGGDERSVLDRLSQSDTMRILSAAAQSFLSGNPAARIENTNLETSGYGNAIVSLANLPGTDSSMAKQYTSADGVSQIRVIGAPQQKDLSHEKLTEKYEVAGVRVDVQLKSMKIESKKDLVSNVGDIAGNVISFLTGDFIGGAVGTAAETLYRSNWYRSEPFYFLVKDWEPCKGLWSGTITVTGKLIETKDEMPGGPRGWSLSRITEVKRDFEYTFTLTGVKDTSEGFQNGYFADAQITINNSNIQIGKSTHGGFCDTGRRDARGSKITVWVKGLNTVTNSLLYNGAGKVRTTVYIAQRGPQGYNILINSPLPIPGTRRTEFTYQFPQCPLWERVNSHDPEERPETFHLPVIEFLATFDPKNPGVLSDSMTEKDGRSNGTITYKWDLQECK